VCGGGRAGIVIKRERQRETYFHIRTGWTIFTKPVTKFMGLGTTSSSRISIPHSQYKQNGGYKTCEVEVTLAPLSVGSWHQRSTR
jgi:hypothetical protein